MKYAIKKELIVSKPSINKIDLIKNLNLLLFKPSTHPTKNNLNGIKLCIFYYTYKVYNFIAKNTIANYVNFLI